MHLVRGAAAACLAALAIRLLDLPGVLGGIAAAVAVVGAVVLLRGCPMCWLVGLAETIANHTPKEIP